MLDCLGCGCSARLGALFTIVALSATHGLCCSRLEYKTASPQFSFFDHSPRHYLPSDKLHAYQLLSNNLFSFVSLLNNDWHSVFYTSFVFLEFLPGGGVPTVMTHERYSILNYVLKLGVLRDYVHACMID